MRVMDHRSGIFRTMQSLLLTIESLFNFHRLKFSLLFAFLFLLVVPGILRTQSTLLDNFENISA